MKHIRLGVNIDHVATLRQARRAVYPDPIAAATLVELAGAEQITVHLREDRRHIVDRDLELLRHTIQARLNLEMAATQEMIDIAFACKPETVTLVPERRTEITTEGGLDVMGARDQLKKVVRSLRDAGIEVSIFVDADLDQIRACHRVDAQAIEIHTGVYAKAQTDEEQERELNRIQDAARAAAKLGLRVAAGHGLNYFNVRPIVAIPEITELNIGHAIVARAVLVGMDQAVRDMLKLLER